VGIYRRGKVYWARWVEDGKRQRRSLGTTDRRQAERMYEEIKQEGTRLKVREVLARWLQFKAARCKPRSVHLYKIVRKRFSLVWGDLRPNEITTLKVEEFQESALRAGLSPRTINHYIENFVSALKWAHERSLIDTTPPRYNRLKVDNTAARKYLNASEVAKLLDIAREPRWQRMEIVVMLGLYAGLRAAEIAWLAWEDVDLAVGWIHIRSKRGWSPKSASSIRSIPIADDLADYLSNTRRCQLWVAPQSPGTRWCRRHLAAESRRLFKAAGVDDGGPHTLHRLRGTFATTVLRGGGDLESLREVLGHATLSVTAGYLAATSESKRRAIEGVHFDAKRKERSG
jgi:site-specific recombinase XerD